MGLELFVADPAQRASIATCFRPPAGLPADEFLRRVELEPPWLVGLAPASPREALRINHMGVRATDADVERALAAIAAANRTT